MGVGTCVVHEQADVEVGSLSGEVGDCVRFAEIGDHGPRPTGNAGGNVVEGTLTAGHEDDVDAPFTEKASNRCPDPFRCSSDDRPRAVP